MVLGEQGSYDVNYNGRKLTVYAENGKIEVDNKTYYPQISTRFSTNNMSSYLVQVNDFQFRIENNNGRTYLDGREIDFSFRVSIKKIEKTIGSALKAKNYSIHAMIPGTVTDIPVKEGDRVEKNQSIIYLEAMKMRNEIRSPTYGRIESINVKINQKVTKDILLIVISPLPKEELSKE